MADLATERIVKTPGTLGGKARIAGHRVRVMDIAAWYEDLGWSPEEIVSQVPTLTLAEVHAALACYYDHRDEVREELRQAGSAKGRCRSRFRSKLKEKLRGTTDPLSAG